MPKNAKRRVCRHLIGFDFAQAGLAGSTPVRGPALAYETHGRPVENSGLLEAMTSPTEPPSTCAATGTGAALGFSASSMRPRIVGSSDKYFDADHHFAVAQAWAQGPLRGGSLYRAVGGPVRARLASHNFVSLVQDHCFPSLSNVFWHVIC